MAKLTLTNPTSLTNESSFLAQTGTNNDAIETALENTLSRDGTSPNQMTADLDMNSNQILNLIAAATSTEPVRKAEFDVLDTRVDVIEVAIGNIDADVNAAAASAAAALVSANNAAASADAFDDLYLGSKSSNPTLDNDGNALLDGALYYNTVDNILKVYDLSSNVWAGAVVGVNTFEGRAGNVVSAAGDYTATEITNTPAGTISATNVQTALNELDTDKLASSSYTAADVLAKVITVDGTGSGLDADLLDGSHASAFSLTSHTHTFADITSKPTTLAGYGITDAASDTELSDHLTDTTAAHAASAISNVAAGNIIATDVQAAINELDTEKLASSSYTAADVLTKLLTVDGPGSGLDADTLDGTSSAGFATATGLSDHLADTVGAHAASAIANTPAGSIVATTVQAAIDELDTEKSPISSPVFTGTVTAPTVDLTSGQIAFPATQNASSGVNTLDDYEEGTFTPVLAFGGTADSTYTTQKGRYIKIGKLVQVTIAIVITNNGAGTGSATITGLPFAAVTDAGMVFPLSGYLNSVGAGVASFQPIIASGGTTVFLRVLSGGTSTDLTQTELDDACDIYVMGTYEAAS